MKKPMKTISKFISILILSSLMACSSENSTRKEFAGTYELKIKFEENLLNNENIKDSIRLGLAEAKKAIAAAKEEVSEEFDMKNIDTTTAEGKIEFASKAFGKGMAEMGMSLGALATEMGTIAGDVADGGFGLAENIMKNLKIRLELMEDGKIKGSTGSISSISMDDATWDIRNKKFYLKSKKDSSEEEFKIIRKTDNGFELEKNKTKFIFTRIR